MAAHNIISPSRSRFTFHVSICLSILSIALATTGCGLTKPSGASFASVKIKKSTPAQIREVTAQVFREDGYAGFDAGPGQMVFQRETSKMANIGQNGFVGNAYGQQSLVRVRAQIVDLGTGTYRLQAQAYFVRDPGFMEDEHPMANIRRAPYQLLLNKVKSRLKKT